MKKDTTKVILGHGKASLKHANYQQTKILYYLLHRFKSFVHKLTDIKGIVNNPICKKIMWLNGKKG